LERKNTDLSQFVNKLDAELKEKMIVIEKLTGTISQLENQLMSLKKMQTATEDVLVKEIRNLNVENSALKERLNYLTNENELLTSRLQNVNYLTLPLSSFPSSNIPNRSPQSKELRTQIFNANAISNSLISPPYSLHTSSNFKSPTSYAQGSDFKTSPYPFSSSTARKDFSSPQDERSLRMKELIDILEKQTQELMKFTKC
jgi:seryl-tRNA synthetase